MTKLIKMSFYEFSHNHDTREFPWLTLNSEVFDKAVPCFGLFVLGYAHIIPAVLEGNITEHEFHGDVLSIGSRNCGIQLLKSVQVLADWQRQPAKPHHGSARTQLKPSQVFKSELVCHTLQGDIVLLSWLTLRLKVNFKSSCKHKWRNWDQSC